MTFTRADYEHAADFIRARDSRPLAAGLVLGSGLGVLADQISDRVVIPYADIPHFPVSTVHGHAGQLVIGTLEGQTVIAQQGRAHFYEGYSMAQITFPIRVMHLLGVPTLILTNAAGGINPNFKAGDIMLITDHINFVGMVGNNPLMGANDDSFGTRFPGMVHTYDRRLRDLATSAAAERGVTLRQGVYACFAGPSFETPAEIRMLRVLGADAVGMSTVHEVLIARHAGMRVLAFSCITNEGIDSIDANTETNHEEVLEIGARIIPVMTGVLRDVLQAL